MSLRSMIKHQLIFNENLIFATYTRGEDVVPPTFKTKTTEHTDKPRLAIFKLSARPDVMR